LRRRTGTLKKQFRKNSSVKIFIIG